jgi:hypothetical protein
LIARRNKRREPTVAVDHDGRHLSRPHQRHDGIRAHRHIPPAAQIRHKPVPAAIARFLGDWKNPDRGAVNLKIYIGARKKASLLPYF